MVSDYDPTGYYRRKAKKNAETMDVFVNMLKYGAMACLIVLAVRLLVS